jgi:hypothetical protein
VAEREEERARLPRGGAPVEEQRERRRRRQEPEEVRSLRAAAGQSLEQHVDGAPLILPLLLLRGGGGGGSRDELSPGRGFGPGFGRGGGIGRGAGGGSGGAARGDRLRHHGWGRRRSARGADVVGTLGGERRGVGLRVGGERRAPSGNRVREWGIFWARAGERRGRLGGKLRRCFFSLRITDGHGLACVWALMENLDRKRAGISLDVGQQRLLDWTKEEEQGPQSFYLAVEIYFCKN